MSTDPVLPSAGDLRYFGRYQYAANSPYRYVDPDGEFFFLAFAAFSAGFTIYDTYQTYQSEGAAAAGKTLVRDAAISAVTGGAGKLAYRGYKALRKGKKVVEATEGSVGAMKRLEFQPSNKHGSSDRKTSKGVASREPTDPQHILDTSVQVKASSPRRVGVDKANGEIAVLDQTSPGIFHGHVRSFRDLTSQQQSTLIKSGLVGKKGKF